MSKYFNYFPKTPYTTDSSNITEVLNITTRFSFEKKFKENTSVYYEYEIRDGDTPEIIADKIYGSPEKHWIILNFNDIIDAQFDWPMESRTLNSYVESKYKPSANVGQTGLSWAKSNIKNYYKVTNRFVTGGDSLITKIPVDANTYANTAASSETITLSDGKTLTIRTTKETQSYFDYEDEINESKRKIKILKPEFTPSVENELRILGN